jgi:Na+:H+ antiporter, NhaA family
MSVATRHSSSSNPGQSTPPGASPLLIRLLQVAGRPLERFLRIEAASGVLLLAAAALALAWANSPWAASYGQLWHTSVAVRLGSFTFERSLEWVVNDALMVVFFFVVGLEIRREVYCGELSDWRRAALPAAAALGGMLAPALLYLLLAGRPETRSGWGVPMATDIAFAVGILTLLGKRVPAALRVLLLALAVIDDLGAIVVIALFYSSGVTLTGMLVALAGFLSVVLLQRLGVRSKLAYVPCGLVAWAGTYAAGVHPTIAGVAIGLMTPMRAWLGPDGFVAGVRQELDHLEEKPSRKFSAHELAGSLQQVDLARREALSPAESLIQALHPWVAFGIMPIFALANAGVSLAGDSSAAASSSVMLAVAVGLLAGKPLGVLLACWLSLRAKLSQLPTGVTWRHLLVLGIVAGVGFTMSLFIAQLAFADPSLLRAAKLGVLVASAAAGIAALILGRILLPTRHASAAAQTADEAEASTEH